MADAPPTGTVCSGRYGTLKDDHRSTPPSGLPKTPSLPSGMNNLPSAVTIYVFLGYIKDVLEKYDDAGTVSAQEHVAPSWKNRVFWSISKTTP